MVNAILWQLASVVSPGALVLKKLEVPTSHVKKHVKDKDIDLKSLKVRGKGKETAGKHITVNMSVLQKLEQVNDGGGCLLSTTSPLCHDFTGLDWLLNGLH